MTIHRRRPKKRGRSKKKIPDPIGADEASEAQWKQQAFEAAPSFQTLEVTQERLAQLNDLLADSPLQYVAAP